MLSIFRSYLIITYFLGNLRNRQIVVRKNEITKDYMQNVS